MAALDPGQLSKRNNFNIFLTRIRTGKDFTLAESNGVKVKLDKSILKQVTSITHFDKFRDNKRSIILPTTTGEYVNINQLYKDSEFGGMDKVPGAEAEILQVNNLNKELSLIFDELGTDFISLKVGSGIYQVNYCEKTSKNPKCDFHFKGINGYVGHISYKMNSGATAFKQWSGTSLRNEPKIYNHPETQAFINTLKEMFPNGVPPGTNIAREIQDKNLQKMSVYGSDYGGLKGENNVDVVMQGILHIRKNTRYYELICTSHKLNNGDDITGDYEPVFMAFYANRNDHKIKNTRIVIHPRGGRPNLKFV